MRAMLRRRPASALLRIVGSFAFIGVLAAAQPSFADWESTKETTAEVTAKALDALIVRPLATIRVIVGAALMVPSTILSAPSGREGIETAYDVLLVAPMEYAFKRELGSF
jgi:hypothetical protein